MAMDTRRGRLPINMYGYRGTRNEKVPFSLEDARLHVPEEVLLGMQG